MRPAAAAVQSAVQHVSRERVHVARAAASASPNAHPMANEAWRINLTGREDAQLVGARNEATWFTGVRPSMAPGLSNKALRSLKQPRLDGVTRAHARAYFDNGWSLYELLFSGLQGEEAFYRPPSHGLRHPMVFYYGHTAVLYINKLIVAGLLQRPIDEHMEKLFEVGVDEMRWDDLSDFKTKWPAVSEVTAYRREAYRQVTAVIDEHLSSSPSAVNMDHPLWALFMGCEHDRIHLETSAVLIRELPLRLVAAPALWPAPPAPSAQAQPNPMVSVPGDTVVLGKSRAYPTYGWDLEYGTRTESVGGFSATRAMVSNAEFFDFVAAGGYHDTKHWTQEGWSWRRFRNAKWPRFWVSDGPEGSQRFRLRHVFTESAMNWAAPVLVNRHEAKAFARWRSSRDGTQARLATEAEHQLMLPPQQRAVALNANSAAADVDPAVSSGVPTADGPYNYGLVQGGESAPSAVNSQGFADTMGNAWMWTEDVMRPLDGFKPHAYYPDFSEPTFDNAHFVISGGSFVSSGDAGANLFSRYQFRPHFLQMSGFRMVVPHAPAAAPTTAPTAAPTAAPTTAPTAAPTETKQSQSDYEGAKMVASYMALHYGQSTAEARRATVHPALPESALDFPSRVASLLAKHSARKEAALDLGCAVGASSLRLAQAFDFVEGVDFSAAFVQAANGVLASKEAVFDIEDHAGTLKRVTTSASIGGLKGIVKFTVGDATRLPDSMDGRFDAVLMANLLCRLSDPGAVLDGLPRLLRDGRGSVLITSPFSWMESFTPRSKWLGGHGGVQSRDALVERMQRNGWSIAHEGEEPLVIRDHARKWQFIAAHAAVFVR